MNVLKHIPVLVLLVILFVFSTAIELAIFIELAFNNIGEFKFEINDEDILYI